MATDRMSFDRLSLHTKTKIAQMEAEEWQDIVTKLDMLNTDQTMEELGLYSWSSAHTRKPPDFVDDILDCTGESLLHSILQCTDQDMEWKTLSIYSLLLAKADCDVKNIQSQTLLMYALEERMDLIAHHIVTYCYAFEHHLRDNMGSNTLHYIMRYADKELVHVYVRRVRKDYKKHVNKFRNDKLSKPWLCELLNMANEEGDTPMDIARLSQEDSVNLFLAKECRHSSNSARNSPVPPTDFISSRLRDTMMQVSATHASLASPHQHRKRSMSVSASFTNVCCVDKENTRGTTCGVECNLDDEESEERRGLMEKRTNMGRARKYTLTEMKQNPLPTPPHPNQDNSLGLAKQLIHRLSTRRRKPSRHNDCKHIQQMVHLQVQGLQGFGNAFVRPALSKSEATLNVLI